MFLTSEKNHYRYFTNVAFIYRIIIESRPLRCVSLLFHYVLLYLIYINVLNRSIRSSLSLHNHTSIIHKKFQSIYFIIHINQCLYRVKEANGTITKYFLIIYMYIHIYTCTYIRIYVLIHLLLGNKMPDAI